MRVLYTGKRLNKAVLKVKRNNISTFKKNFVKTLAELFYFVYNVECWSLTAMKREVTDTPGRFAMASVWEIFTENVYIKIGEKEGK